MGLHIPEEYGGAAAGSLAFCLAAEEVAWACASTSTIFLVQNLGGYPIIFGGNEEQKRRYLPRLATGEMTAAFSLSESGSGSDAAAMLCAAVRKGDRYVVNGSKMWVTNGSHAGRHHGVRVDRARPARQGRHRAPRRARHEGVQRRQAREEARHPRVADRGAALHRLRGAGREPPRRGRRGVQDRDAHARAVAADDRRAGRGHRPGGARRGRRLRAGAAGLRSAHRRVPGHPVHAGRHGHGRPRLAPRRPSRGRAHRPRARRAPRSRRRSPSAWPPTPP